MTQFFNSQRNNYDNNNFNQTQANIGTQSFTNNSGIKNFTNPIKNINNNEANFQQLNNMFTNYPNNSSQNQNNFLWNQQSTNKTQFINQGQNNNKSPFAHSNNPMINQSQTQSGKSIWASGPKAYENKANFTNSANNPINNPVSIFTSNSINFNNKNQNLKSNVINNPINSMFILKNVK